MTDASDPSSATIQTGAPTNNNPRRAKRHTKAHGLAFGLSPGGCSPTSSTLIFEPFCSCCESLVVGTHEAVRVFGKRGGPFRLSPTLTNRGRRALPRYLPRELR